MDGGPALRRERMDFVSNEFMDENIGKRRDERRTRERDVRYRYT